MTGASPTREELLAALAEADDQLLRTASDLKPDQAAEPSLLPGWSRGHVLTHLARNADGFRRVLAGAARGETVRMYDPQESREADIEAGAGRALPELLDDLREAVRALDEQISAMPAEAWTFTLEPGRGAVFPAEKALWRRYNEVEYHHVDLDAGYTPAHWPALFVGRGLELLAERFAGRDEVPALLLQDEDTGRAYPLGAGGGEPSLVVAGPSSGLLAWLSGRAAGDGLTVHRDGVQLADARAALPQLPPMG